MVANAESEKLIVATELLLKNHDYLSLYKLYLDLIKERILEIGIRLGITPPDKKKKIYEFMFVIDSFIYKNTDQKLKLFKKHIETVKSFFKLYKRIKYFKESIEINKKDIEPLVEEYYILKSFDLPNVYSEIEQHKGGFMETYQAFGSFFGKKSGKKDSKEMEEVIRNFIDMKIENESKNALDDYDKNKISFGKCFEKIASFNAIKSFVPEIEKKNKRVELKGRICDNFNYQVFSNQLYGFVILAIAIAAGVSTFPLILLSYITPPVSVSVSPYIFLGMVILFVSIFIYYKNFIK